MTQELNTSNTTSIQKPSVQIQCDWEYSFKQKETSSSKFWINIHRSNKKPTYSEVEVTRQPDHKFKLKLSHPEQFDITSYDPYGRWIEVKVDDVTTKFHAPVDTYEKVHTGEAVECIGLSAGGNIAITGSQNGKLRVWDARSGTLRRDLQGHVGDIYVAKILPSSEVAMSASADTQIKIWRLSDGLCAATLKGHSAGVLSLSFIDRGRNFTSSSRDGTVRLWDCATQSEISTLVKNHTSSAVVECCVDINTSLSPTDQPSLSEKDFSTQGKILLCASANGSIKAVDIRSRTLVFNALYSKTLTTCGLFNGYNAFAGSNDGHLVHYDLRYIQSDSKQVQNVFDFKRGDTAIYSLAYDGNEKIWCASGDGSCYLLDINNKSVLCDLTGPDSKLSKVACNNKNVYTCCKDGRIRRYHLA
ncbi:PAAF1 [Acrasis kona]|uniref:PAAF1 n=1 Tax=Acrasis kona TaxID=1008807 RepID=A0AAW2YHL7_9EUKA